MIIGSTYVYLCIPRTASVSVSNWLKDHYGGESFEPYHSMIIPKEHRHKYVFATVRDPYTRFMSLWNKMRVDFWDKGEPVVIQRCEPIEFAERLLTAGKDHLLPQRELIRRANANLDREINIYLFEELPWSLCRLPFLDKRKPAPVAMNQAPHEQFAALKDPELIRAITAYEWNEQW